MSRGKGANRRLLGERVNVRVAGCPPRDGVLLAGVKKETKYVQKFPIRFPNGDVRSYRGDQLLLRGTTAPLTDYIRVGDICYTKQTLGVIRFIGSHEDFPGGPVMVMESVDPKLPSDPNISSFRKTFPSANLSDSRSYSILTKKEDFIKILPPDAILQQLSRIKDKYLAFVADTREKDKRRDEDEKEKVAAQVKAEVQRKMNDPEAKDDDENESPLSPTGAAPQAPPNSKTITFGPGRLGIKAVWTTGKVEGVSNDGQAQKLGVKVGWSIALIDGQPYTEELIDSKTEGGQDYVLTFDISGETDEATEKPKIGAILTDTDKESYERRINELNEQIEDFQYTVESLQAKNSKLEDEHKEMTKLRVKVEHLRNSRVMFMSQIREMQKRVKDWKAKAEEWESKYNKLAESGGGDEAGESPRRINSKRDGIRYTKNPRAPPRAASRRRPSSTSEAFKKKVMPKPDAANTLSLTNYQAVTTPKAGDGSSQFVSLSNLKKSGGANGPATPEGKPPKGGGDKKDAKAGADPKAKKKKKRGWFKSGKDEPS